MPKPLRSFSGVRRVRVTSRGHDLFGRTGTVHRIRRCDDGAWVRMDEPLPVELRSFPEPDERARDVILFPADCQPMSEPILAGNILHHGDGSTTVVIPAGKRIEPDNAALVSEAREIFAGQSKKGITIEHARALLERLDDVTEDCLKRLDKANAEIEQVHAMLAARDESLGNIREIHVRDCKYITRLENANSTLHQSLADEQRERELLVEAVANAMGELSEFFRQANRLRGKGTPRSITRDDTHEPPRIAAVEA